MGFFCRLQNKLRMFKLLSLQDEYAYLLLTDYLAIIDRLLAAEQACCLPSHSGPCMDNPMRSRLASLSRPHRALNLCRRRVPVQTLCWSSDGSQSACCLGAQTSTSAMPPSWHTWPPMTGECMRQDPQSNYCADCQPRLPHAPPIGSWLPRLFWGCGRGVKTHDRLTDTHVSLLLNLGLLSRHSHTADQYLFAVPNAGPIIKGLIGGRKVR